MQINNNMNAYTFMKKGASLQRNTQNNASVNQNTLKQMQEKAQGCKTCASRQYQDQSNDPGVSFKNATNVSPNIAASAIMGHEDEHANRESDKAENQGREIIYQNIKLFNGICPECKRVYVAGGVTNSVSASKVKDTYSKVYQNDENILNILG